MMIGAGFGLRRLMHRGAHARRRPWTCGGGAKQELPGLQKFVDGSIAGYKDATVKAMLQDTAVVISQFQTAAAAGKRA